ncbi:MAG: type IV pilus secretin PilQ [Desulfobacterales bacterium]|nr:type IV pilus secretin PilQ [Desulfobacterales bacterium]
MTTSLTHLINRGPWPVVAMVMAALLAGCAPAAKTGPKQTDTFTRWQQRVETSRPHSPSLKARDIALPEPKSREKTAEKKSAPGRALPTKNVTMSMRNTDVNVILRALAQAAGQNIMMNAGVKGTTQVDVKNTPWNQVFLAILRTRGLTYAWEGNIIRVMSVEDLEHDLKIEEVQQQRKSRQMESKKVGPLLTRVIPLNFYTIDRLKEFSSIEKNINTSSDTTSTDQKSNKKKIEELFEKLLTKDENGKEIGSVTADTQTNSLVVHALRDDLAKIVALVEKLDRPTIQVLLEAHIIETTKGTARALGIQWAGAYAGNGPDGNNHWITAGANASGVTGGSLNTAVDPLAGNVVNLPADLTASTLLAAGNGLTIGFVGQKIGSYLLDVQLSALEAANKLNILSTPSITTLDNQMAVIESGKTVPFQTVDSTGNINIDFKDATLRLEVTPHVIDQGQLKLMIIINKDEVDFTQTVAGNPTIIKKTAMTNLILADGATTVIGGLSKESDSRANSGIPYLQDLPGVGKLFKNNNNSSSMEEVLIFITPHILKQKTDAAAYGRR